MHLNNGRKWPGQVAYFKNNDDSHAVLETIFLKVLVLPEKVSGTRSVLVVASLIMKYEYLFSVQ